MILHDENRPRMGDRLTWLSQKSVIPPLEIWVKETGEVEVRMFLPILGGSAHRRYHAIVDQNDLPTLVTEFSLDPEATVVELFAGYKELRPDVEERKPKKEPGVLIPERKARAKLL